MQLQSGKVPPHARPTVVFVHGAFADSSSWNGVANRLLDAGYPLVALANPLRSVASDAAYVADALAAIEGEIVLVGHSYGGAVISVAARASPRVAALVFVAAFAPDEGESAADLAGRYPGSTLGTALAPPVRLASGDQDLSIRQDRFAAQFAADVPAAEARLMSVAQRPIAASALAEATGTPAWKELPSWFIHGSEDRTFRRPRWPSWRSARAPAKRSLWTARHMWSWSRTRRRWRP
jgi:pimeloyl-ACP methyl ester carboxylesterase